MKVRLGDLNRTIYCSHEDSLLLRAHVLRAVVGFASQPMTDSSLPSQPAPRVLHPLTCRSSSASTGPMHNDVACVFAPSPIGFQALLGEHTTYEVCPSIANAKATRALHLWREGSRRIVPNMVLAMKIDFASCGRKRRWLGDVWVRMLILDRCQIRWLWLLKWRVG
jgi:hypothetical protein